MLTRRQLLAAGASVLPTAVTAKGASRRPSAQGPLIGITAAYQDYVQHLKQAVRCHIPESYRDRYDLFFRSYGVLGDERDSYVLGITSLPPHADKDVAIGYRTEGKFARVKIVALWDNTLQEFVAIPVSGKRRVTRESRDDCIFLGEDSPDQPRFIDVYETTSCDPCDIVNWSALPI